MYDEQFMQLAIQKAREAIQAGQVPVGVAIGKGTNIVGLTHNTVWRDCDPTAHAEINGIRMASFNLRTIFLNGCTAYATLEPCPMCMSALMWTKVERVLYGASIADAVQLGFPELWVSASKLAELAKFPVKVEQYQPLQETCVNLFREWQAAGSPRRQRVPGS